MPVKWVKAVDDRGAAGLAWDGDLALPVADDIRRRQLDELQRQVQRLDNMCLVAAEREHRHRVAGADATSDEAIEHSDYEQRQFRVNLGQRWMLATGYADVLGVSIPERQQIWYRVTRARSRQAEVTRTVDDSMIAEIWRGFCAPELAADAGKLYELLVPDPDLDPQGSPKPTAFPSPHALLTDALRQRREHRPAETNTTTGAVAAAIASEPDLSWDDDGSDNTPPTPAPTRGLDP
ncbi:hypothetical protein ACFYO1_02850 [Nocardia sp. NPDC006044]|uniref:hypothetical protein n=1 Tax=Nocardia sp. NPDC006044 TaxID=3364306 RepID=UPI0036CD7DB3